MKEGVVPCSGIDTEAKWGYIDTKGWVFGYKLHMICSIYPSSTVIPLSAMLQQPTCLTNLFIHMWYHIYPQRP